ncbi:MAG: two-component system, NtrC family, sensor kinase [Gemmatimonadales bacterium]|jgi:DNA-binding response OmpR family regulator|nr:two-component system, NtrC family, sensor kinase [Gemmatimonadales bacterium]
MLPIKEASVTPHLPQGLSLLLVEDDLELAAVMQRWAAWVGVSLDVATRGADALRLIIEKSYAAVLLDLSLPDIEGPTLYDGIVTLCPHLASRVIILTGGAVTGQGRTFLEATSCPVMLKPFDLLSLARQIAELDQAA